MLFGYRYGEVKLPAVPNVKGECLIQMTYKDKSRTPLVVEAGLTALGVACPRVDPKCAITMAAGAMTRFCRDVPCGPNFERTEAIAGASLFSRLANADRLSLLDEFKAFCREEDRKEY